MQRYKILWADDEIDLLKPHILFLEDKGYDITSVYSGSDAVELFENERFDVIFLDENMPGISGLEALSQMKEINQNVPVVMITKSEEEYIMEEAIGSKISDYLIKPLNPNQILLSLKKLLNQKQLVTEKTNQAYQQDFRNLGMALGDNLDDVEWIDVYKKLVYWELEIENTVDKSMEEVLVMQKQEANKEFAKFIKGNYGFWFSKDADYSPVLSYQLMDEYVFPELGEKPVFFFVIDNLRYDQWKIIEPEITQYFSVDQEELYYSILPTATGYARNAIFSGLMPDEMAKIHSDIWVDDTDEEGQNMHEEEFLTRQLNAKQIDIKTSYHKILRQDQGKDVLSKLPNLINNNLNVLVYNFVDMLSHARTDSKMIRELAPDESAYRSLTRSWFEHSPLYEALKWLSKKDVKVILTTDHGTVRVKKAVKIVGDKTTNTNLRYKHAKNLSYNQDDVFSVRKPSEIRLPAEYLTSSYVFATDDSFFAYPNNYNYYVNYYKDTFQHGGVSLEEILIPIVKLGKK